MYFSTKISKNEGIEKDDNNKDRQYLFIFQKTEKNRFLNRNGNVINLTIYFHSVMVAY